MWRTVELQEIIEGLYDGPHATPKESDSGAIFLGIKNVSEDGRLDLSDIRYIALDDMAMWTKRVTPRHKDIVFSYEATLHRYARIPENFVGCLGRRMALVRIDETKCNGDFLFSYFLSSVWRKEVEKYILPGATVDRIPLTTVPNFKLTIPPLPIQKEIAEVLSAYDDLIEANLKRIKLLEEIAQITYEEWFVRHRFPKHDTTPLNPETGLPEGWAMQSLGQIISIKHGYAFKGEYFCEAPTSSILLTPGNFKIGGGLKLDKIKYYSDNGPILPDFTLDVADLLVTMTDLSKEGDTLGYPLLVPTSKAHKFLHNQRLGKVLPKAKFLPRYFLYHLFKSEAYRGFVLGSASGATVKHTSPGRILAFKAVMPIGNDLLEEFDLAVGQHFKSIDNLMQQNVLLKEARDLLLPRLMTGMIDIDDYLSRNASAAVAA